MLVLNGYWVLNDGPHAGVIWLLGLIMGLMLAFKGCGRYYRPQGGNYWLLGCMLALNVYWA